MCVKLLLRRRKKHLAIPGGPTRGLSRAPQGFGSWSYSHKNMVENFIVIQLIFAEKFVSQDFTIMAVPGLSGPDNTCAI